MDDAMLGERYTVARKGLKVATREGDQGEIN